MKILLLGNFGSGNYGDEAILIAMLSRLIKGFDKPEFFIVTSDDAITRGFLASVFSSVELASVHFVPPLPFGFRSLLKTIRQRSLQKTLNAFKNCDKALFCGGGLFTDEESFLAVPMWASYAFLLNHFQKPIFAFGMGVGPLKFSLSRALFKRAFRYVKFFGVRDNSSRKIAEKYILQEKVHLTGDSFLLFPKMEEIASLPAKDGLLATTQYIVLSLRPYKNSRNFPYKKVAQALDGIVEEFGFNISFLPFQEVVSNDTYFWNKIFVHIQNREHIFSEEWTQNFPEILRTFSGALFIVGMRFHASLFSIKLQKPFLALPYALKSHNLIKENVFDELSIGFEDFQNEDKLVHFLRDFMAKLPEVQEKISFRAKELESSCAAAFSKLIKSIKQ